MKPLFSAFAGMTCCPSEDQFLGKVAGRKTQLCGRQTKHGGTMQRAGAAKNFHRISTFV
jgi:hypothetical protein